ncbi:MAG: HlyD family efflux transporter periplasmic adaptor subunit [Alphaproteobacteria bacterium]|nr:HlyD family efflux transporter periplasmic adaptor subunit [Alphaproteobacteria bacterium]
MSVATRRGLLWGVLLLLLAAGLVYAFRPQPVPVDFALVERGPLIVTVSEEGETRVRDVFVLSAPIAGRARRIEAEVGDPVTAAETVVAEIQPIDPAFLDVRSETQARAAIRTAEAARDLARAELERAQAELVFAETEVKRARRLIGQDTISQRRLDEDERSFRTAKADLATAQAALDMRNAELERARAELLSPLEAQGLKAGCPCVPVTAPVSGRVLRVIHESEGVVSAGQPLIEIGDPTDLEIVSDLLSSDAVKVEPGQRVMIEEWGGDGVLNGQVERVEPYGFTKVSALGIEEQRVNVIIDFTDPPQRWQRLGHGYRVEVGIVLWDGAEVLKVPLSALFRDGDDWAVFVEVDGRAKKRRIEPGRQNGLESEVRSGLDVGDRIVLHPSDRVVEDVRLTARD